jgi:hypothetical protein
MGFIFNYRANISYHFTSLIVRSLLYFITEIYSNLEKHVIR